MRKRTVTDSVNNKAPKKAYLKTGIMLLVTLAICGWVIYGLFFAKTATRYNDFTIDSAIAWLENADSRKFDSCRKNIVDTNDWFDWFVKDRKSLGDVKSRALSVRQDSPGATAGMKRYELKFGTQFSKSRGNVSERLLVETDGQRQFKVILADYWLSNGVDFSEFQVSDSDKAQIMAAANDFLQKMAAKDVNFFKQRYAEWAKNPDYFGWNQFLEREMKNPTIIPLPDLQSKDKASALKFIKMRTYIPNGRTGFECSAVEYRYTVNNTGEDEQHAKEIALAMNVAEKWLALVDAGKYQESWAECATIFKQYMTATKWEEAVKKTYASFGKQISRKEKSSVYKTKLPGIPAPEGRYVVIKFKTDYNNKFAVETVTLTVDTDGQWRVCGDWVQETKDTKDTNDKSRKFGFRVYVDRDLYLNKFAEWKFNAFNNWEE
jgi:hypothetical protein